MTITVSKANDKKTNADIIANGGAEKGPVKQFFARMLDKLGVSKFKARMAERREERDSKVTHVANVSKEDQKTFAAFNYNPYLDCITRNL
ncbi:MAG: hypothetical protein M1530_00795 [Candidatus Marsarchaeota archaeon]|nr:hypothetical protein [Candidatus Marsarchaeota archaeon]